MSFTDLPDIDEFYKLELALSSLTIYRDVAENKIIRQLRSFLSELARPHTPVEDNIISYAGLLAALIREDKDNSLPQFIAANIIRSVHPLNELISKGEASYHPTTASRLSDMAINDLTVLQRLAGISSAKLKKLMSQKAWDQKRTELRETIAALPSWENGDVPQGRGAEILPYRELLHLFVQKVSEQGSWPALLSELFRYHQTCGVGEKARFAVLRFSENKLIEARDVHEHQDLALVDYNGHFTDVIQNTQLFSERKEAENLLIYSPPGSGKHRLMRELIRKFGDSGLKFILFSGLNTAELTNCLDLLQAAPGRFLFVLEHVGLLREGFPDSGFSKRLKHVLSNRHKRILIYAIEDVEQSLHSENHGKLFDCDEIAHKSVSQHFDRLIYLRLPGENEFADLLRRFSNRRGIQLTDDQIEQCLTDIKVSGRSATPAAAMKYTNSYAREKSNKQGDRVSD